MDITKLTEPAEKLFEFAENEYVKLRLFPLKARYQIEQAKLEGIDTVKLAKLLNESKPDLSSEGKTVQAIATNEAFKTVLLPEFNGGIEYKILACLHGVDPIDHSFEQGGKSARLDRAFWENLLLKDEATFNKIQRAVENFQTEYGLSGILNEEDPKTGEPKGNI